MLTKIRFGGVDFAKKMRQDALEFEKAYKMFDKALARKDPPSALQAVSDMGVLVADYRQAGRLKDDDGNIPSIDEIGTKSTFGFFKVNPE